MTHPSAHRLVAVCYQSFTLSDGALRMLALLHMHARGGSPLQIALSLLPYEIAGVFTNLLAGRIGAQKGLKPVLLAGLLLQAVACVMLAAVADSMSMLVVMAAQAISGIAKDLVKTSAKSYVRTLAKPGGGELFSAVAWITGSKNAMKGLGFFVGGALLSTIGFFSTNVAIAAALLLAAWLAASQLPQQRGKDRSRVRSALAHGAAVNWLALARMFLFGSRDVWFAVALPVFAVSALLFPSAVVGGFLSLWVIGYGAMQAATPRLLQPGGMARGGAQCVALTFALLAPLAAMWALLRLEASPAVVVPLGLIAYGIVFAMCSSVHSWLVVQLGDGDDTAERVGFYYAANSLGRLAGLIASGWIFGSFANAHDGFAACIVAASAAVVLAALASLPMAAAVRRVRS